MNTQSRNDSDCTVVANGIPRRLVLAAALVLWGAGIASGFILLQNYETTRGLAGRPPDFWPMNSRMAFTSGQFNIVMLAHPRCPCTRASLEALQELVTRHRDQVAAHVLFLKPPNVAPGWEQSDLWRQAAAIRGVQVHADGNGDQAKLWGAATSGQVVVYDGDGRCLFSGGLTTGRGQRGQSQGTVDISMLISGSTSQQTRTPVFGCPLFNVHSDCEEGNTLCQQ